MSNRIIEQGLVDPKTLRGNPDNFRTHPKAQMTALAALIDEVGWVAGVTINQRSAAEGWPADSEPTLVDGHARLKLALEQNIAEIPFTTIDLSPDKERLLLATLDKVSAIASVDTDKLAMLLAEIDNDSPDLQDLLAQLERDAGIGGREAEVGDDIPLSDADRLQIKWQVKPGDLYQVGAHRILCGDSTKPENWVKLMKGERAQMVWLDPPYGIDLETPGGKHDKIEGDDLVGEALIGLLASIFTQHVDNSDADAAFYIWHDDRTAGEFQEAMRQNGLEMRGPNIIWAKPAATLSGADYQHGHESCYYASIKGRTPLWYGGRDQTTLWEISIREGHQATLLGNGIVVSDGQGGKLAIQGKTTKGKKARTYQLNVGETVQVATGEGSDVWYIARENKPLHPTQKPTNLAMIALRNSSSPGDIVIDGTAGAGGLVAACEALRREARAIEIVPKYVACMLERLSSEPFNLTPKKVTK